ncbi:MAG: glycerophosphoryl diester phosphodiesterase membrane domain-containing protein [Candidatus Limnocylindria bacterium]
MTAPTWNPAHAHSDPARPRRTPVADLFEETIRLYRRTFVVMAGVSAAFQIPILLATLPVYAQQGEWYQRIGDPTFVMEPEMIWGFFGATLLIVLVATIVGTFGAAATVFIAGRAKVGDQPSFGEVFRALWRLAPRLLGYLLVWLVGSFLVLIGLAVVMFILLLVGTLVAPDSGLAVFWLVVGMLAIFVVGTVAVIRFALSLPVLVLERQTPIGSLRRSWNLVRGATLRTLGIFVVAAVAIGVVSSVTGLFYSADMFEGMLTGNMGTYLGFVLVSGAVNALVYPILPALMTLLYYDYAGLSPGLAAPE